MRKIIILAGLLASAALFTGTPANAWVGCTCVKIGAPAMCSAGPIECSKTGGICVLPCDYTPAKMMHHHHHHKMKKKM